MHLKTHEPSSVSGVIIYPRFFRHKQSLTNLGC